MIEENTFVEEKFKKIGIKPLNLSKAEQLYVVSRWLFVLKVQPVINNSLKNFGKNKII